MRLSYAGMLVLVLQFDDSPEEIESDQGKFATLPGKIQLVTLDQGFAITSIAARPLRQPRGFPHRDRAQDSVRSQSRTRLESLGRQLARTLTQHRQQLILERTRESPDSRAQVQ